MLSIHFLGLKSADECTSCDKGSYCDAPGLTQRRGACDPGYICTGGATSSSPTDGVTGDVCPAGGYCLIGMLVFFFFFFFCLMSQSSIFSHFGTPSLPES